MRNCHHCAKEIVAEEIRKDGPDIIITCSQCLMRKRHRKNREAAPDLGIALLTCPELTIKGDP